MRQLLAHPRVRVLLAAQLLARMPSGIWPIAMLLHVEQVARSFGLGGSAVAAMVIARAVASPITTRLAGRIGIRVTIVGLAIVSAAASAGFVAQGAGGSESPNPVALLLWAALCGLATPPVQAVARVIIPRLVDERERPRVFAFEAAAQEMIFVIGPLVAVAVAAARGPGAAMLVGSALMLLGVLWFAATKGVRLDAEPAGTAVHVKPGRMLLHRSVWVGAVVGFAVVAASSGLEAALVARFGGEGVTVAVLLGVYSAASLIGGVALSRWVTAVSAAWWASLVAVGLVLAALAPAVWAIGAGLLLGGLGVAPLLASLAVAVPLTMSERDRVHAFGWIDTGAVAGAATGFAVAGAAVDGGGAPVALAVAAGFGVLAAMLAGLSRRR